MFVFVSTWAIKGPLLVGSDNPDVIAAPISPAYPRPTGPAIFGSVERSIPMRVRMPRLIVVAVAGALLIGAVTSPLWLGRRPSTLSRSEVISAATNNRPYPSVVTKLISSRQLHLVTESNDNPGLPWDRYWIVAVSGDYGILGSGTNSTNTWGVAVVPDKRPITVDGYLSGTSGTMPPFWNELADLSSS